MGSSSKKLSSRHSATHRSGYHAVMDAFMSHNAPAVSAINGVGQHLKLKPATQVALLICYASQADCVKRNSRHNLRPASTVRCRSFSVNNLLACLAKLRGAILGHRLCFLCSDDTFNPLGVSWLTQGAALLAKSTRRSFLRSHAQNISTVLRSGLLAGTSHKVMFLHR